MFKKMIAAALLAAAATLVGCGSELGPGTSSEDAGNNNPETAVTNDAPVSQPDVPVTAEDAGNNNPDVATDTGPVVEDRPSIPADDGEVVMMATFSSETCARFRERCWYLNTNPADCESITCEMQPGGVARVVVPANLAVQMGFSRAICSGDSCRLHTFTWMAGNCYWVGLSPTMSSFTCQCDGASPMSVESR